VCRWKVLLSKGKITKGEDNEAPPIASKSSIWWFKNLGP
jgi:hypothetical protein